MGVGADGYAEVVVYAGLVEMPYELACLTTIGKDILCGELFVRYEKKIGFAFGDFEL